MIKGARSIPHRRAWIVSTAAFVIHNVEEAALGLPAWIRAHPVLPWLDWMAPEGAFHYTLGIVSLGVCTLALHAIFTGPTWSPLALQIFAIVMLLNAASHIALSAITASVMPGATTAALVILPVMAGVLHAVRQHAG